MPLHPVTLFGDGLFVFTGSLLGMVSTFLVGRLLMALDAVFDNARENASPQRAARGGRRN